ncbi:MAG: invasion associated locus B family protein [Hyphomicrobiaceae bacterium]
MNGKASIFGTMMRGCGALAGLGLAVSLVAASGAIAQQKKQEAAPKAAAPAPAAAAPEQAAGPPIMWVKLCEKAPVMIKDKDNKDVRAEKSICLTHHERLDGNTGMVLVSAAVRQVEGVDKQHLMIMVPLGMAIQPGLKAAVYNKDLWEKAQKNEKVDDAKLATINLKFTLCHPAGCTAEIELTKDIVDSMKSNAGLMVFAINANGQVIAFPVPLSGFGSALDGQPVDNVKYSEGRRELMKQLAARQQAIMEEAQKQQGAGQQQPASAPAAAPAKAAPKAADKK